MPGTGLVLERAVKTGTKCWAFELSVWEAVQRLENHHQRDDSHNEKGESGEEARPPSVATVRDGRGVSRFQGVDLPHPGWEDCSAGYGDSNAADALPTVIVAKHDRPR